MTQELRMRPAKHEMVRAIGEWVVERAGVEHAYLPNLDRLTITELQLMVLAMGHKLNQRDIVSMESQFRWEWERIHGKKATVMPDGQRLIGQENGQ